MWNKIICTLLTLAALALASPAAWADHWTKTYIFQGSQDSQTQNSGYFYEEGSPSTHYNSSPSPWTIGSTGSLSFALDGGVTLTLTSSTNHISVHKDNGFMTQGSAMLTLGGGRYFYHVRLFDGNGNVVGFDANGNQVVNQADAVSRADYWGLPQDFTCTYANGIGIKKIEIFYGNTPYLEDIATGSGTSSDPYVITNTTMMEAFARSVAASHTFEGQFVTLGADIAYSYDAQWDRDMSVENNYTAIGGFARPFRGTFDGQGHTVSGIRIYKGGLNDADTNQGLFGYIGSGGTVKNVILRDACIYGREYIGGIVGYNSGNVAGCYVVNTYVIATSYTNRDIIVGYQDGGTYDRSSYRDCAKRIVVGGGITQSRKKVYVSALYSLTPGTGVGLTRSGGTVLGTSGVTVYDDGATEGATQYYIEGSSVALTYTGGTVPAGYEVNFTATAGSINGSTLTMPADHVEVTASVVSATNKTVTAHQATLAGQTRYWATFYHPTVNYELPAGAQAFYMGSDHALYRIGAGSIIPAHCAVVIMAESASITLTATNASAPSVSGNILQGTSAATTASTLVTGNQKVHVLSMSGETLGFFEYTGTDPIPANKAYYVE